jgi:hypothetical protein
MVEKRKNMDLLDPLFLRKKMERAMVKLLVRRINVFKAPSGRFNASAARWNI